MKYVDICCKLAAENSAYIASRNTAQKNKMLSTVSAALKANADEIISANAEDLKANADKPRHHLDRLMLNSDRIYGISEGVDKVIALDDPIGEVLDDWTAESGIHIRKVRVPLGVVGIIYEARPNVTVDVIALCIKSGNAVVLRGSKDAINSNTAIVKFIKLALEKSGFNSGFIQLIEDTGRESSLDLMKCRAYVDVLLPRGSSGLINFVVENSSVPVIETGAGNCHAYLEATADPKIALDIILNGKLQRPSVCNALESLLVDRAAAKSLLPDILGALDKAGVEIFGDEQVCKIFPKAVLATEEDYFAEYSGLKISVKLVDDYHEAIVCVNKYGTHHSDVIITKNEEAADAFLAEVDSAAVYVNASTRFTDGFEFGFGAEMGISTQKLHARGPIGLKEMTSTKYVIKGDGQIRK